MQNDTSLQVLLDFDPWATGQILGACEKLTDDQFGAPFEMGPGSLRKTLTHILGAIRSWTETLAGKEVSLRMEEDGIERTVGQLKELVEPIYSEFAKQAGRLPLEQLASRTFKSGRKVTITRREIFLHVVTHGMHHRAQCLNMLKKLGVAPLPPSSLGEWGMMRG